MSSVLRRITAGLGANALSQATTIGIQMLSLPVFLYVWDKSTYGQWLLLSAIPAYIGMADVGMVTAAANSMTIAMGRGDVAEARRVFQSALAFTVAVCAAVATVAVPVLLWMPLHGLDTADERGAVLVLTIGVLASILAGLDQAVFRATGRYAAGSTLSTLTRLGEWAGTMLGLWISGTFAAVALGGLVARVLAMIVVHVLARRGNQGLAWGVANASRDEIKAMIKPATSFMAFPIATALSLQGVTLAVGYLFGTAAVAVFSTYRTLSRVAIQLTTVISWSVEPEFSRLFGQGGMPAVMPLYRRSLWVCGSIATGLSLVLYVAAPTILQVWTHGAIPFEPMIVMVLLAYAAAGGLSQIPRMLLMATNQHVAFAVWSLIYAGVGLLLALVMGKLLGLAGVGLSMLVAEALIAVTCTQLARHLTAPRFAPGQPAATG